jgi:hypothetical protein
MNSAMSIDHGAAVLLTARDQRPGLATVMVALPTLFVIVGAVAFAIAVSIHGF